MTSKTASAVAILVGTTIGAGIFALPYAVNLLGFARGLVFLIVLGLLILLLHLIYGEVILRTPGDHQLTGYSQIYLGKYGRIFATVSLFIGFYGALLAYLVKIGQFAALITGLNLPSLFSLFFWAAISLTIYAGLRLLAKTELILVGLMLFFIVILSLVGLTNIRPANYFSSVPLPISHFFFAYGVILFSLIGFSAIPEMEEILRSEPAKLKKAIILGTFIPLAIYLLFVLLIIGISGSKTSQDAISGLIYFLPAWITKLGAGLGILTMSTSFLALGYALREVWYRDFELKKKIAFWLAVTPPLLLFLSGANNFILILEYTGALTGGLTGLLIINCFWKAKSAGGRIPAYSLSIPKSVLLIIGLIFLLGIMFLFFS
jgi:tyrosine-specific transport protein